MPARERKHRTILPEIDRDPLSGPSCWRVIWKTLSRLLLDQLSQSCLYRSRKPPPALDMPKDRLKLGSASSFAREIAGWKADTFGVVMSRNEVVERVIP
jgi:hypothetical protein